MIRRCVAAATLTGAGLTAVYFDRRHQAISYIRDPKNVLGPLPTGPKTRPSCSERTQAVWDGVKEGRTSEKPVEAFTRFCEGIAISSGSYDRWCARPLEEAKYQREWDDFMEEDER